MDSPVEWTRPLAGECTPVQKWNSPQGGQVHYTDAAAGHQMTAGGLQLCSLSSIFEIFFLRFLISLRGTKLLVFMRPSIPMAALRVTSVLCSPLI